MVSLLTKVIGDDRKSKELDQYATQLYKAFDRDDSGTLSFQEFLIGYYLLNSKDDRLKLKFVFRMYDINKDEKLDKNEIKQFAVAFSRASRVNRATTNLLQNDNFIMTLITELDMDQNGYISESEFIEGLIKNPEYVYILLRTISSFYHRLFFFKKN
jgi:Ca2+-binding EF-hand superfamily protein